MVNRWKLTDEVKDKYTSTVKSFINKIESINIEESDECLEVNFSDTELNPYTLGELLESLGYELDYRDDNGWQFDYWIYYKKKDFKPLCLSGTGIVFELNLSVKE